METIEIIATEELTDAIIVSEETVTEAITEATEEVVAGVVEAAEEVVAEVSQVKQSIARDVKYTKSYRKVASSQRVFLLAMSIINTLVGLTIVANVIHHW